MWHLRFLDARDVIFAVWGAQTIWQESIWEAKGCGTGGLRFYRWWQARSLGANGCGTGGMGNPT